MNLIDLAQQHLAIVGRTGAGKTFTAKGIVEQLIEAGRRVIVLDPTGAWWGLASRADGTPGLSVAVLGGEHGGAALPADRGAELGTWLATREGQTVLDLSEMLIGERHRFVEQFSDALYRSNRAPLYLIVDEADEFMPQNPLPETRRMLHHMDRIVRRGRIKGFRVMMITQRPAVLHKNVLTQANALIAMRLTSPQDRKAIEAWVEGNADAKQAKEVMGSLARLQRGEGWVWAPEIDVLERRKFPRILTFDSSRAPDDGDVLSTPALQAVDYGALRELLESPEADDEDETAGTIARLQARIRELEAQPPISDPIVDHAALEAAHSDGYLSGYSHASKTAEHLFKTAIENLQSLLARLIGDAQRFESLGERESSAPSSWPPAESQSAKRGADDNEHARSREDVPEPAANREPRPASGRNGSGSSLSKAERLVLTALAQYPQGRTRVQVALLTGYAHSGGGFNNAISALRSAGCLQGDAHRLQITAAGRQRLGSYQPLPRGRALLQHWLGQLGKAERKALEELAAVYPRALSKAQLANRAGYEANGGGFNNALSRLRTLELVKGRADIKASEDLFG